MAVLTPIHYGTEAMEAVLDWLEEYTKKPVLGVLPYLHGLHLDAEDALPRERQHKPGAQLTVVVPALPRISNHTDFDPLRLHPQVDLRFAGPGESLSPADLIIIPGSKSVRQDLAWLRQQGWDNEIARHLRYGGKVLGICGGLQMLGNAVHDPTGVEGAPGTSPGLAYLDLETELAPEKQLRRVAGTLEPADAPAELTGYEIHAGRSNGPALDRPLTRLHAVDAPDTAPWPDGAVSPDGRVAATYVHGLFESSDATTATLKWAGLREPKTLDFHALRERNIDRLADACDANLDIEAIIRCNEGRARARIRPLSENSDARIGVESWSPDDLYES